MVWYGMVWYGMVWAILSPKISLYRSKGNLSFLEVKRKIKKGGKIMGLVSGIVAKARNAEIAKSIAKNLVELLVKLQ